ncbi:hypothetical protein OTK49_21400 [Vibrio coralliirubri]|uniref:hypothetical protein n=1 Tax=Vibrio coralliirubri TaxID=1516159 RepID=UPI002284EF1F|nr:hypothetical protein [Vibrio coralliirubri]MCY9865078.1 hypothetical protein [Vibrio coralliirubri]
MSKSEGFALYNAASSILGHFDDSFSTKELLEHKDPRSYVGSIDISAEDCEERVMTVSATVDYKIELAKGKSSHYKCNFTIKEENINIEHGSFRTRTISIKQADLKDKEKVIAKIKECRTELTKLLAEGKAKREANALIAGKSLAAFNIELDTIQTGLGDALQDTRTSTYSSSEEVCVTLVMSNSESVNLRFNGTTFELCILDAWRTFTTEKLVTMLSAIYL